MSNDLFAPPTDDERKAAEHDQLFAPPSKDELAAVASENRPKSDVGGALLRGAAQGASLGFADEATAGVGALRDYLEGKAGMHGDVDLGGAYDAYLKQIREADKEAKEDHPSAFTAGEVGGGLATAAVPGLGALNPAAAETALGRMGVAAAAGGISGAGHSEASLVDNPVGLAADTALGAGEGALTQGVLDKAAPVMKAGIEKGVGLAGAAGKKLQQLAETKMAKAALGNNTRAWQDLDAKGPDAINEFGRTLIDDKIGRFGSSAADIAERAGKARQSAWDGISELFPQIDQAVPQGAVSGKDIANSILNHAVEISAPNNKGLVDDLLAQAQEFENMGDVPLKEAQRLKNLYKFDRNAELNKAESNSRIKSIIGDQMERGVGRFADAAKAASDAAAEDTGDQFGQILQTGNGRPISTASPAVLREAEHVPDNALEPEKALELYQTLKKKYGMFDTAEDAAEKESIRQAKNNSFSVGDKMAAGITAKLAERLPWQLRVPVTLASGVANKVVRGRGNAAASMSLDKIGSILQQAPEKLGRYAPVLQDAARRGNHALAVTHFVLQQQDPEYRQTLQDSDSDSD